MANLSFLALERLFVKSPVLKFSGNIKNLFLGISDYLENCRIFAKNIQAESVPTTSTSLIDEWVDTLGVTLPRGADLAEKRRVVGTVLRGIGGQSLDYLNDLINDIFPEIYIEEAEGVSPYPQYIYVRGVYDYSVDYNLLKSTILKLCPLHLDTFFFVRSKFDATLGVCGIGACGESRTGMREIVEE